MGRKSEIGDPMDWPEENEYQFMQLLCERVKKDPNHAPNFRIFDWEDINKELAATVGVRYGAERLKVKYNRFRIKFRHFLQLLETSGVAWNAETNTVQASDKTWQALIKQSKDFRTFRKRGCKHYDLLKEIFPNLTGGHQFPLQMALNSNEEHEMDEVFLNRDLHIGDSEASGGSSTGHSSQGGSSRGGGKPQPVPALPFDVAGEHRPKKKLRMEKLRMEKFDEALHIWVTAFNASSVDCRASAAKDESQISEANSSVSVSFSIENVMDILESMEDVPSAAYMKAVEKLMNPDWRKIFVKMSAVRRREWLKTLE